MNAAGASRQQPVSAYSSRNIMRLSIIIVSYNVRELLRCCLQSVYASARLSADWLAVDVTVVDNASHDGSAQMVADEFPDVHLVASPDNLAARGGVIPVYGRS